MYEFWFRNEYKDLVMSHALTQFVRPDDRTYPNPKGTRVGERALVRILIEPGESPTFEDYSCTAVVASLTVKKVRELDAADFLGASPDAASVEGVLHQLKSIYGKTFSPEDTITAFTIEYEEE